MRYSLFDREADAIHFAAEVKAACDKAHVEGKPVIFILPTFLDWCQKWCVARPVEPEIIRGEDISAEERNPPVINDE